MWLIVLVLSIVIFILYIKSTEKYGALPPPRPYDKKCSDVCAEKNSVCYDMCSKKEMGFLREKTDAFCQSKCDHLYESCYERCTTGRF